MTHLSPAIFGMWSVCSALVRPRPLRNTPRLTSPFAQLTTFCFYHIWHYDRFKCLRMNHGPYSGAFKRLMTVRALPKTFEFQTEQPPQYTYILTLPLITIYSLGNAVIKYQEGFVINGHSGGRRVPFGSRPSDHSLELSSGSKTALSMDQGSPRCDLPVVDGVLDRVQPRDVRDPFSSSVDVTNDKYLGQLT